MSSPDAAASPNDRVLPATRILSIAIIPFLVVAFVLLYFWPSADDTGRLFAWRIIPSFTPMVLAAVYLGGAYFFFRAARAQQWHTVGGGFLSVGLFATLMCIATILHWSLFIHTNLASWLACWPRPPAAGCRPTRRRSATPASTAPTSTASRT